MGKGGQSKGRRSGQQKEPQYGPDCIRCVTSQRIDKKKIRLIRLEAWVLHKDSVAAPIVGISKIERFEETLAALDVILSDDEMKYLEEPYQP